MKKEKGESSKTKKEKVSVAEILSNKTSTPSNVQSSKYDPDLVLHTESGQAFLLKWGILGLIYLLAFLIRLFSVVRYESIIHEFDPWFNFRTTQHIVSEGFMDFLNWFDERSWYPLGRHIGGTIYPGLMATAGFVHYVMNALHITIDIRNVCVLIGPFFASNTAIVAYLMSKDIHDEGTGLFAAAFVAIVPGFISRSVAGSYDNEAVAIFALLLAFYMFVRAVKTGSMLWAAATAIGYFYMVAAWGGYIYITNLLPLYTLVMVVFGRFSHRLYIAYSVVYVLGTLMSMQVFIVEFKPVRTAEHMPALGVFCLLQVYGFLQFVQSKLSSADYQVFRRLAFIMLIALGLIFTIVSAYAFQWTGRLLSLFNLTHAKQFIPIISSVAEHQPALWDSLFFDTHILIFLVPTGLYWCFKKLSDGSIFLILYALSSLYFASAMVRLVLVVAPIVCLVGAVGISFTLRKYMAIAKGNTGFSDLSVTITAAIVLLLLCYASHSTYVASEAYSSPSIVLQARGHDGSRIIFDDFREAYRWLSQNTKDDEIVMSWWDYGYQISGMGNRTVLVDGNTRNNTHIARVGRAFASNEETAWKLARELDVDYALVIFGGLVGYASDDINKFLWMVRISGNLFPEIREADYLTPEGHYRIDSAASKTMLNSLMYKLCYYRFGEVGAEYGRAGGFDRVRNAEIGNKKVELKYFEEAYTTQHWLVRIYKLKKPSNLN